MRQVSRALSWARWAPDRKGGRPVTLGEPAPSPPVIHVLRCSQELQVLPRDPQTGGRHTGSERRPSYGTELTKLSSPWHPGDRWPLGRGSGFCERSGPGSQQ